MKKKSTEGKVGEKNARESIVAALQKEQTVIVQNILLQPNLTSCLLVEIKEKKFCEYRRLCHAFLFCYQDMFLVWRNMVFLYSVGRKKESLFSLLQPYLF